MKEATAIKPELVYILLGLYTQKRKKLGQFAYLAPVVWWLCDFQWKSVVERQCTETDVQA